MFARRMYWKKMSSKQRLDGVSCYIKVEICPTTPVGVSLSRDQAAGCPTFLLLSELIFFPRKATELNLKVGISFLLGNVAFLHWGRNTVGKHRIDLDGKLQCSFWWQVWKEYMVGLWYSFQLLFDCVVCVCVYVFCHFFELWICNVYIDTYIYVIFVFFILHIYICWVSIIQCIHIIDGLNRSLYPLQTKSIRHLLDVENVSPVYYLGGSWGISLEFQSTLP